MENRPWQRHYDYNVPLTVRYPRVPALIQFTGGTTGLPKGAVLTHGNLVAATLRNSAVGYSAVLRFVVLNSCQSPRRPVN